MATLFIFRVLYHYELNSKRLAGTLDYSDNVAASAGDAATLTAILVSNGRGAPAGVALVIDMISNAGYGLT